MKLFLLLFSTLFILSSCTTSSGTPDIYYKSFEIPGSKTAKPVQGQSTQAAQEEVKTPERKYRFRLPE